MESDGSDGSSSSHTPPVEANLFPSIRKDHNPSDAPSEQVESSSDKASFGLFRNWKARRRSSYSVDQQSASVLGDDKVSSSGTEKDLDHTITKDRHGLRFDESGVSLPSLDSSILSTIRQDLLADNTSPGAGANSKLKYVAMYEKAIRKRDSISSDSGSVFGISQLDEYSQFLELSKIDQYIDRKLKESDGSNDANVLTVVDEKEFDKYYSTQPTSERQKSSQKRFRKPLPWRKFFGGEHSGDESKPSDTARFGRRFLKSSDSNSQYLHRKLEVRHLQMISFGATLGVGLYLNSGKAFSIAGGLGTLLAFVFVGMVVLATVVSFCEMVTFVSVVDGVSGLSSRFIDESFGFATGWLYFLSFSFGLAGETVACAIILSYFSDTLILTNAGVTAAFVTAFLLLCFSSNIVSVRIFGEIEYVFSLMKMIVTVLGIIIMIVINRGALGDPKGGGAVGFKYWQYSKSDFQHNLIFGPFRPTFDLSSSGSDPLDEGIGGDLGRFLSILVAIVVAAYAYSGTEIVCIAACEAKEPRKALPSATNRVFWRILLFYCLASFVVSLNIYAGDPRLLRYYSGTTGVSPDEFKNNPVIEYIGGSSCINHSTVYTQVGNGSQSPWTVAFQTVGLCNCGSVVDVFLFLFAFSCGNSQLYVSSRTLYSLALQRKAPGFLRRCNRYGIPYYAVSCALIPALSAYTCVSKSATAVFQNLTSLISSSGVFIWFTMCLSFIRFYFGLKKRPDIVGRLDKSYPYKSPFQPYSACFGAFGAAVILLCMGYVVFLKGYWNTMFFFSSYGTFLLFALLYLGHRIVMGPSASNLEALDFDSGRRERDIYIWDGGKEYNIRKVKDLVHKAVDWIA